MTPRRRAVVEFVLAILAAAACALSWLGSRTTVEVAPIADGEPSTTSIAYYAPLLVLSFALVTVAGVLVVLAVANLRRQAAHTPPRHRRSDQSEPTVADQPS